MLGLLRRCLLCWTLMGLAMLLLLLLLLSSWLILLLQCVVCSIGATVITLPILTIRSSDSGC